jgi:serine/threonine protein kinase
MIETGKLLQQRYRIDKQIGQGGMGAVYVATDERFGSTVAIKETLFMDDNYRKAIEREARLLNSLKHVALPRVSDHFLEDNVQFLVMEYIPGEDLSHMLESGTTFEVDRVLKWADQLLDALEFLHSQSIPVIHRDIKPQNLKLTARDQIILLDFGLAKGNPTDAGHQTAAKSIFGYSRNYASLEQIQGTGTDPRSDLYSLAATLYHILTSAPPEDALTRAMAVLSNRPDPLTPANSIRAEIPAGVAGILQNALSLNADDRPATANAMRKMFREEADYGYLVDRDTVPNARAATDVFGQQTKIMPSDTRHDVGGQTDVKTAVMPGFISQETSVRPSAKTGDVVDRSGNRRGWAIAFAFAAVLVACGSAAGLYFYDPSIFGDNSPNPAVAVEQTNQASQIATEPNTASVVGSDQNTNLETPAATSANSNPSTPRSNASTRTDTARSQKPPDATPPDVDPNTDIRVHGDTIYMGNVKVTPNGIMPNVYVDPKGVKRAIPPPVGAIPFPGITREQFEQMTPQQRQKILDARRQLQMLERRRDLNVRPSASPPQPQP